jgi:5-methylcytosine-specific restriction endonuclease McrA
METIKRMPICRTLTKQQREWLDGGYCPICGLHKRDWKRRTDWTCCSVDCSKKYQEECWKVWQFWKLKAFERDKFTCVKCGEKPIKEDWHKTIIPDTSKLIGDHIVPIAIGGEEYDLGNVQTLCIKCNKIKTKEDIKKIAIYKKQNSNTTKQRKRRHSSQA